VDVQLFDIICCPKTSGGEFGEQAGFLPAGNGANGQGQIWQWQLQ